MFCPIVNCDGFAKKMIKEIIIYAIMVINFATDVGNYGIKMKNVKKKKM